MQNPDVLIIGAGAAGSSLAYKLSRSNVTVMVLERGPRVDPTTFSNDESIMMPILYRLGGIRSTTNNDIGFLQGQGVGGSTVINNAIWLRADLNRILPAWANVNAHIDGSRMIQAYQELEGWLKVKPIQPGLINDGTGLFMDGCAKLGVPYKVLDNNRENCLGCGWCNYGCKYNRKTSALVTFVPWAEQKGAEFISGCTDILLNHKKGKILDVSYVEKGIRHTIKPKQVVVSCGAIGSSELLFANNINPNGNVGTRFSALGGVLMTAESSTEVASYDKIGLTCISNVDNRYLLETFFQPPGAFSITMPGWGKEHFRRMKRYAYMAQVGVMIGTKPTGKLLWKAKAQEVSIKLTLTKDEIRTIKDGMKKLAEIFIAGKAVAVYPGTVRDMVIKSKKDIAQIDQYISHESNIVFGSAHPQGGNPMSDDPAIGVVDSQFKVHGFQNLFVADASVIPDNIWANCQATVMGLSNIASDHILKVL